MNDAEYTYAVLNQFDVEQVNVRELYKELKYKLLKVA